MSGASLLASAPSSGAYPSLSLRSLSNPTDVHLEQLDGGPGDHERRRLGRLGQEVGDRRVGRRQHLTVQTQLLR